MMTAYLFAPGLGGVLLIASIVLGGDGEADGDLALDGDVDADADLALEGDVDADADDLANLGQQGLHTSHGDAHGSLSGFVAGFLSLRFWTFALAFFGLTGTVLAGLSLAGPVTTVILASVMGVVVGRGTVALFSALRASESSLAASEGDYIGKSAKVILGFGPGELGKVRLQMKGTTVDLLAQSDDPTPFSTGDEVMIIQLSGAKAQVTHAGRSLPASEARALEA